MRKISTFCRLERIICRAIIACTLLVSNEYAAWSTEISLPEAPPAQPPPQPVPGHTWEDGQREKHRLQEDADKRSQDVRAVQKVAEMEAAENSKTREYYGFSDLNFYLATANVRDHRSDYSIDPGVQFSTYVRSFWNHKPLDLQLWYGLRIAPFGGYGTQDGLTARFAHTWMGPAIGVGRFWAQEDSREGAGATQLMLLSAGIAGVSRLSNPKDTPASSPEDFQPTTFGNDAMGTWIEFRWARIRLGALGIGALLGVQTGSGKVFSYIGANCSAYY